MADSSVDLTWALSIIALTLMVRMVMVPLTVRQIHSMQNLQMIAPELKAMQQVQGRPHRSTNEEIMNFYKENQVNPRPACRSPSRSVFIALFFVLRDFEDEILRLPPALRPRLLGLVPDITDPTNSHWSGYLLLVLYVVSQRALDAS